MNIAVLYTGQVRLYHDFKENIKYFLSDINADVDFFCTTWYEENVDYKNLNNFFKFKVLDIETYNPYTSSFIKNYENFHNFCKNFINNDPFYLNYSHPGWIDKVWQHTPCVFYKLYRGFNIIKKYEELNNKKYDIILRLRFDCLLLNKISNDELIDSISDNKLHIFQHDYEKYLKSRFLENDYFKYQNGWVDDTIFFSNIRIFEIISELYNQYFDISTIENVWIIHLILKKYLKNKNIEMVSPKFKISLVRPNNTIPLFDYLFNL